MKRRNISIALAAALILAGVIGLRTFMVQKAMAGMLSAKPPPPAVSTDRPTVENWQEAFNAVATLQSFHGVVVSTEVAGMVRRIAFQSGDDVKAGDLLIALDTSTEEAQRESLQAALELATANLARARELRKQETNSQSDLDVAEANFKQATAALKQVNAAIAKKQITAPFSGRLGIKQVDVGQYLAPGASIVMLEAIDSIYADFGLPQQDIAKVSTGMKVTINVDAFPGQIFTGTVEAVNPRVSDDTRNVRVRAVIPNPERLLRPGMFGSAVLELTSRRQVLALPATSVTSSPYGDFVYAVVPGDGGQVVQQRFVTLGDRRGDLVAIQKGVSAQDEIVTTGQMKLRNNLAVRINNTLKPDRNPAPTPTES